MKTKKIFSNNLILTKILKKVNFYEEFVQKNENDEKILDFFRNYSFQKGRLEDEAKKCNFLKAIL